MPFPKSHKFRGVRYKLRWRKPPLTRKERHEKRKSNWVGKKRGVDFISGKFYPAENGCAAMIYINPAGPAVDLLDSVIHESLHACYPDLEESAVTNGCASIWLLLKKMGIKVSFTNQ